MFTGKFRNQCPGRKVIALCTDLLFEINFLFINTCDYVRFKFLMKTYQVMTKSKETTYLNNLFVFVFLNSSDNCQVYFSNMKNKWERDVHVNNSRHCKNLL